MAKAPPPPPTRGGTSAARQAATAHAGLPDVSAPTLPVALLAIATATSVLLALLAWRSDAGDTTAISSLAVTGWLVGGLVVPVLFSWFRSADLGARANLLYVEPGWRPQRVATLLAVIGFVASIGCAILVARSWARR